MLEPTLLHPGHYIRSSILPHHLTVKDAAKQLGVGRPALSNLLNGRASLSSDMAMRIEKAFGTDGAELLKMQAAYDKAQIQAREPEIAVRAYAPSLFNIKAMQIEAWSQRMEARSELAVFLRRLVVSTALGLTAVDFPGYENAQRHGWDGFTTTESATPWVPLGNAGWEFGVNQNPAQKAEHDYNERSGQSSPEDRAKTTFVFVTPRNWPGKTAWITSKTTGKAKIWKEVRVYDASDIEQWLETSAPAQAWFAEHLGISDQKIFDLEGCWRQWADVTNPPLSKEFFTTAGLSAAKKISQWLSRSAEAPFTIVADSDEEALAALASAFDASPLRETNAGERVIVVRSAEALAKIATASASLIVVLATPDAEFEAPGLHRRQHTIVITRRNAIEGQPDLSFDLVDDTSFRAGLEAMGVSFHDVQRLSHESGHSLTVLRRRLSVSPALKSPPWANERSVAERLIPLVFVGAWDAVSDADCEVIVGIAATNYNSIEKTIAELVGEAHAPVWSVGHMRGVVSKTDAFYAVQRFVTSSDLHRFFDIARIVLAEEDPSLEMPKDKQWMSNLYGKTRKHSGALRQGICETLVLFSVHGDNLFKARLGFDVSAHVNSLIRELLTPLDGATWQSQRHDLPRYAEAAPDVFLDLLEEDLRSSTPKVYALMQPADSQMFSSPGRTGLLWALEILAWNPNWLFRVVTILAKLAELKISDNWVNKPENSLAAIFRCWMPQTSASIDQRLEALELLVRKSPEVGWRICLNQINLYPDVGHYSSRPSWRRIAAGAGEPVTNLEAHQMARRALDIAIAWHHHTEQTLGDLIERISGFSDDQDRVWSAVILWAKVNPTDESKASLRERIRRSTMTTAGMRRSGNTTASEQARAAYEALTPEDIIYRHGWLFEQHWVQESAEELAEEDFDFQKREDRIGKLRETALKEVVIEAGYEGIVRLCELGEAAWVIGWHLAGGVFDASQTEQFIVQYLNEEHRTPRMKSCVSGLLAKLDATVRMTILKNAIKSELYDPSDLAHLFQCAPFGVEAWQVLDTLPKTVQQMYWNDVLPSRLFQENSETICRAIDELLDVERPRAAFNACGMVFSKITSGRLMRLLVELATNSKEQAGHYQIAAHDVSEAFKELSKRPDVIQEELARLEFLYIDALRHSEHGIRALESQLSISPELFMQALALAFRRNDGGDDPSELRPSNENAAAGIANSAYTLLTQAKILPGTKPDATIDLAKMRDWLRQVRNLTRQHAREAVGDSIIGQLFARAPAGADGMWPNEAVRDVLEDFGTADIANGMITGKYNSRGAVWRGEGGGQERELAQTYRETSARLGSRYPFTARMLEGLASMYDRDADWHDTESKTRKRLRH